MNSLWDSGRAGLAMKANRFGDRTLGASEIFGGGRQINWLPG
jgi:hypothetical protein